MLARRIQPVLTMSKGRMEPGSHGMEQNPQGLRCPRGTLRGKKLQSPLKTTILF